VSSLPMHQANGKHCPFCMADTEGPTTPSSVVSAAGVAQLEAQTTCNRQVVGSSPTTGSFVSQSRDIKRAPRCHLNNLPRSTEAIAAASAM
jgi:hypothetical protein